MAKHDDPHLPFGLSGLLGDPQTTLLGLLIPEAQEKDTGTYELLGSLEGEVPDHDLQQLEPKVREFLNRFHNLGQVNNLLKALQDLGYEPEILVRFVPRDGKYVTQVKVKIRRKSKSPFGDMFSTLDDLIPRDRK